MLHLFFALTWLSLTYAQTNCTTYSCIGFYADGCDTASNQCTVCVCNFNSYHCMLVTEAHTVAMSDPTFVDIIKTQCQMQVCVLYFIYLFFFLYPKKKNKMRQKNTIV